MKLYLTGFFICCFWFLWGADSHFSGTASERHQDMTEHYDNFSYKIDKLSWWDYPYLTGDWKGGRSKLARDGVTISSSYVADILGNPVGGKARGVAFAGSFGLDMNVDIGKYTALNGLSFYISMVGRTGTNLSEKIGNQFNVAQVYGGQNIRLNELYLKQTFSTASLTMKVGRLDTANDFLQSDLYYKFVNNGFDGNPVAVFVNGPFFAYPNATWGYMLRFRPFKRILGKVGLYAANKRAQDNKYHGFNWSFHGTDGAQFITEWSIQMNQLKEDIGYKGNYRIGFFYYTDSKGKKFLGGHYHGNWGYYILLDQMIYRHGGPESKRGLTPFMAFLFAPENRNPLPFYLASGLVYEGLFPSRPKDSTNLGFIYGKYSKDQRKAQALAKKMKLLGPFGDMPQNFEALIEFNHWFQVNPWWTIVPDIQYIINPKGFGNISNAWVIGAQVGVIF